MFSKFLLRLCYVAFDSWQMQPIWTGLFNLTLPILSEAAGIYWVIAYPSLLFANYFG